jgi:hypothetical protein
VLERIANVEAADLVQGDFVRFLFVDLEEMVYEYQPTMLHRS